MDTEFVSCPDNSCDVKQEVLDEVDPLAVSSEVNIEFAEYMIKVDNVEEPAECMGVEDCGVMVKQEIIEVVEDMKVELDEESDDVKIKQEAVQENLRTENDGDQPIPIFHVNDFKTNEPVKMMDPRLIKESTNQNMTFDDPLSWLQNTLVEVEVALETTIDNKKTVVKAFQEEAEEDDKDNQKSCASVDKEEEEALNPLTINQKRKLRKFVHDDTNNSLKILKIDTTMYSNSMSIPKRQRGISEHVQDDIEYDEELQKYKCKRCDKFYKLENSIVNHLRNFCNTDSCYACEYCPYKARSGMTLSVHYLKYHSTRVTQITSNVIQCSKSKEAKESEEFYEKEFEYVVGTKLYTFKTMEYDEEQQKYKCKSCGILIKKKNSILNHLRNICTTDPSYACEYCSYKARSGMTLRVHYLKYHSTPVTQIKSNVIQCSKSKKAKEFQYDEDIKLYTCKTMEYDEELQKYKCKRCYKLFKLENSIVNHLRNFCNTDSHYACEYCPYKARSDMTLKVHCRRYHSTPATWIKSNVIQCSKSKKAEESEEVLEKEFEYDEGTKLYTCKTCEKTFKTEHSVGVHTGVLCGANVKKTYKCHFCPYTGRSAAPVRVHMGKKHGRWPKLDESGIWIY